MNESGEVVNPAKFLYLPRFSTCAHAVVRADHDVNNMTIQNFTIVSCRVGLLTRRRSYGSLASTEHFQHFADPFHLDSLLLLPLAYPR